LTCKRVAVHFIYSFCLEDKDSYLVDIHEVIKSYQGKASQGKPRERKGITPHLTFKSMEGWVDLPKMSAEIWQGRELPQEAELSGFIRLFPVGCSCCITVTTTAEGENRLDCDAIMNLLRLVRRSEDDKVYTFRIKKSPLGGLKTVFEFFERAVVDLCRHSGLEWLERKRGFISEEGESQNPWVVVVIEDDDDLAKAFCSRDDWKALRPADDKMERMRPYLEDIASILYRSVTDSIVPEPAYLDRSDRSDRIQGIKNENLDARLFVSLSRRAILCIGRYGPEARRDSEEYPADYFLPGLLDLCEMVRVRWHMLIVMNRVVDEELRKARSQFRKGKSVPLDETLEQIMRIRAWLATSLEDPGIYVIAGDALSKLHGELQEVFRIQELREMILGKVELVDRLFTDLSQWDWYKLPVESGTKK